MSTPPDQMAKQTLADSHKLAGQAAAMHSAALQKLLPMLQGLGAGAPGGASAPSGQGDTEGPNDQDADEQAVWDEFPSTDPQTVAQLMQGGGDPSQAFQQFMQMAEQDEQSLHDKQMQALAQMLAQMSAPQGNPLPNTPPQNPAVGSDTGAAY